MSQQEYRLHQAIEGKLAAIAREESPEQAQVTRELVAERARLKALAADPYHALKYGKIMPIETVIQQVQFLDQRLEEFDASVTAIYLQLAEIDVHTEQ